MMGRCRYSAGQHYGHNQEELFRCHSSPFELGQFYINIPTFPWKLKLATNPGRTLNYDFGEVHSELLAVYPVIFCRSSRLPAFLPDRPLKASALFRVRYSMTV